MKIKQTNALSGSLIDATCLEANILGFDRASPGRRE